MAKGKRHNRVWPPLDLLNCAAILEKEGFHVNILDANAERTPINKIVNYSKSFDKIFISSSSLDRWQCPNLDVEPVEKILRRIKNKDVYLTGAHGSLMPDYFLDKFNIKAVIIGEPEMTTRDICKSKKISKIPICFI